MTFTLPAKMTEAEYRAAPGVNWSTLKHMSRSPLHYRHASTAPSSAPTPAMALGTLAHLATLEPHRLSEVAVWTGGRRAGKAWDEWEAANAGRLQAKPEELAAAETMAAAVRAHPWAARLLSTGYAEVPLFWIDPATGLPCKARLDWYVPPCEMFPRGALPDLKSARDVSSRAFERQTASLGYHGQLAHYGAGVEAVMGVFPDLFVIAVESDEPYDVGVFELLDDTVIPAQRWRASLLARVAECIAADRWPGQHPEITPLMLPAWAATEPEGE